MAKRDNSPTLYSYVKDHITKLIISGEYPADSKLPTEFQLMDELGVGRATVRTALAQLEHEGTIYKRQGVGTFVSKRSNHYGLEPFISLSFNLKNMGISENNDVLKHDKMVVLEQDESLLKGWDIGTEVYCISRLRKSGNTPLAVEDNYYSNFAYSRLDKDAIGDSISHNLLTYMEVPINKMTNDMFVRSPSAEEMIILNIKKEEKVVVLDRWMYVEGIEEPIYYAHVIFPTHVLEFPFLG